MKPRALDLFCGAGGATMGLMRAGFHVTGVDINNQPRYVGDCFRIADALRYPLEGYDFIWASSPCEEFSVWGMAHFHPNPKYPAEGIRLFNGTRERLEASGLPYIMENVRPAQKFIGYSANHCGPFHFWGNCVPAIFPPECYKVKKGIDVGSSKLVKMMDKEQRRVYRAQFKWNQAWSTSPQRGRDTATAAMIPEQVSEFIGRQALEYIRRAA